MTAAESSSIDVLTERKIPLLVNEDVDEEVRKSAESFLSSACTEANIKREFCELCPFCHNNCHNNSCRTNIGCQTTQHSAKRGNLLLTPCQVKRHNHRDSAWIVCGNEVFAVTSYISYHPGGEMSILRRASECVDCSRDLAFHSPQAIKLWKKMKIGTLVPCPGDYESDDSSFEQTEQCIIS